LLSNEDIKKLMNDFEKEFDTALQAQVSEIQNHF